MTSIDFQNNEIKPVTFENLGESIFFIYDPKKNLQRPYRFKCESCNGDKATPEGESKSEWSKGHSVEKKLFDDPTPNGQINQRIVTTPSLYTNLTDLQANEKDKLISILLLIGRKLVAVWRHKQKYCEIEDELIDKARSMSLPTSGGVMQLEIAEDLFIEWDEFLVQLKSSLDYLVKVPIPILGERGWNLRTFGKKGEEVVRTLRQNTPKHIRPMAKAISEMIIKNHQPWLEDVIEQRDRVNHLIGAPLDMDQFMVLKMLKDGEEMIRVPMWNHEQSIRGSMEVVWDNLLHLFEDFIVMFLYTRFDKRYSLFHGEVDEKSGKSPWKVVPREYQEEVVKNPGWKKLDFD